MNAEVKRFIPPRDIRSHCKDTFAHEAPEPLYIAYDGIHLC